MVVGQLCLALLGLAVHVSAMQGCTNCEAGASPGGSQKQNQKQPLVGGSVNPCVPHPCGPNTDCSINNRGVGVCRCLPGFFPKPDTVTGCGLQCTSADECGKGFSCNNNKCVQSKSYSADPCSPSHCGAFTNCQVKDGRAICSCFDNYTGDPLVYCHPPECVEDGDCPNSRACVQNRCQNVCISGACGENAQCEVVHRRPVCKCPQYYKGSALTRCFPECVNHEDCAADKACIQLQCADPCAGACGIGANCSVRDHTAICSCPPGFLGHPYDRCTAPEHAAAAGTVYGDVSAIVCDTCAGTAGDMCTPNPCGQYAECTPGTDKLGQPRAICTCPKGYLGDPLKACQRGECEEDSNCPATQACYNYICTNPCLNASGGNMCGTNALCRSLGHRAVCYCPAEYTGEPLTECRLKPIVSNSRSKHSPDGVNKA